MDKIDKIHESIKNIEITLAKQHISLEEHMRRTELLEEHIKPIQKHVIAVQGVIAFLLGCAALAGLIKVFL
jgi:hypothetical protein